MSSSSSSSTRAKEYADYVLHPESHTFTMDARNRVISATAATIIAETLIAPTNVIKQRQMEYLTKQSTTIKDSMPSNWQTARNIMSESGYMGLFHGYYSNLFKQIGYKSLVLFSYEPIRNQLIDWKTKYLHPKQQIEPSKVISDIKEKIQYGKHLTPSDVYDEHAKSALVCLTSGGLAGMIGYSLIHPVEAFSSPKFASPSQLPLNATTSDRIEQTKYAGKSRFWLKPNLMYVFFIYATEFGGYDYLKAYIMDHTNFAVHYNMSLTYVVSAATVGVISSFISVPADILRSRSMDPINKVRGSEGVFGYISRQINEEGILFRRRLMLNMTRKVLWLSGFFLTYEQLRHYLNINYSNSKIIYQ